MSPTDPTPTLTQLAPWLKRVALIVLVPPILAAASTYLITQQNRGVTIDPAILTALESVRTTVDAAAIAAPTDDATRIGRLESRVGGLVAELAQLRAELTSHIHPGRPVTWPNHPGRLGSAPPNTGSAPIGDTGPIGSTSSPPNGPP